MDRKRRPPSLNDGRAGLGLMLFLGVLTLAMVAGAAWQLLS